MTASGSDTKPLSRRDLLRTSVRGEIFSGLKVVTYDVPGLPRGVHHFTCDPHPYMVGAVKVT